MFEYQFPNGEKDKCWSKGLVTAVCKGKPDHRWKKSQFGKKYSRMGKAAEIEWNKIDEDGKISVEKETTIVPIDPKKWNKYVVGGWRFEYDIGSIISISHNIALNI